MKMRYYEFKLTEDETAALQTQGPRVAAPAGQPDPAAVKAAHPADEQPAAKVLAKPKRVVKGTGPFVFDNVTYANKAQQETLRAKLISILKPMFPVVNVRNDVEDADAAKAIPSIRILNALPKQNVIDLLANNNIQLTLTNKPIQKVSGTYTGDIYSYTENNIVYTIVIAGKRAKDDEGAQIGIQMLRPEKFGLLGSEMTRQALAADVKAKIPSLFGQDPQLASALSQLVDVAVGARPKVDAELMTHISSRLNYIAQDFGEILTPLAMESDSDIIQFSRESNSPLIDVHVGGKPVAVKSLGGSGNSFAAIKDLIATYEQEMQQDPNYKESTTFAILKDLVGDDGRTTDKLIRAAQKAQVPEAIKLNEILGTEPMTYAALETAVQQLVSKLSVDGTADLYKRYLETVYPASTAAQRMGGTKKNPKVKPVGLPKDWTKYVQANGEANAEESSRAAGKKKFDANFVRAASRQLTYMLGMGFKNFVVDNEESSKEMQDTLKAIMSKKDATVAHIEITPQGTIKIKKQPFSSATFGYQYHAGTDTVNANAPGFHYSFN